MNAALRGLEAHSQRRSLVEVAGVNLCSNDYLGLAASAELRAAVVEAVERASRVGGTGSRLLSGHSAVWDAVEEEFAEFLGVEAALYFGSGYTANVGLLSAVMSEDDLVFSDESNHASLIDGIRLSGARKVIYPHLDLNFLERALREYAADGGRKFIVTETVFSMDGDVTPVSELVALAERFGAEVILDEAHATAVHGAGGRGIGASAGVSDRIFASTHTCGKALASAGAFVCGAAGLREYLINHARTFIFSTAMPPYMAGQISAALRMSMRMDEERAALLARSRELAANFRARGWRTGDGASQIVPVIVGENEEAVAAAEFLLGQGFAVRAIRPPTVREGTARLRFSVTCGIAASELARLEVCMESWRAERNTRTHAFAERA
ncbi:MAG TPA: 8-amino-7-oxononanoate synthase [Candidatus Acidoferrum sp.]